MTPVADSLASQHHAPVLDTWGYEPRVNVGFVGGATKIPVKTFATMDEAFAVFKATKAVGPWVPSPHRVGEA